MNNPNLFFDGAVGGFIRKSVFNLVSTDSDLEAQHEITHKVLTMGTPTTTTLMLNISHATALGFYFGTDVDYDVVIAPINDGDIPVWKSVTMGTVKPTAPAGSVDSYSIPMTGFTLDGPRGTYWMEIRLHTASGDLTFPLTLQLI